MSKFSTQALKRAEGDGAGAPRVNYLVLVGLLGFAMLASFLGWLAQRYGYSVRDSKPPGSPISPDMRAFFIAIFAVTLAEAIFRAMVVWRVTNQMRIKYPWLWTLLSLPRIGIAILIWLNIKVTSAMKAEKAQAN